MTERAITVEDLRDLRAEMSELRRSHSDSVGTLRAHLAECALLRRDNQESLDELKTGQNRIFWVIVALGVSGIAEPHAAAVLEWLKLLH